MCITFLATGLPATSFAQRPEPETDDERAADSFYESLSPATKIGLGALLLGGVVLYDALRDDGGGEATDGESLTLSPTPAPVFVIDAWAEDQGGGIGIFGSW